MAVPSVATRVCVVFASLVALAGCSGYSALNPGNSIPALQPDGWVNLADGEQVDSNGAVLVISAFATW